MTIIDLQNNIRIAINKKKYVYKWVNKILK